MDQEDIITKETEPSEAVEETPEAEGENPKKRGLGRGLDALFEDEEGVYPQADSEGHTPPGQKRMMLGVGQLEPWRGQPRGVFNEDSLKELADSIKAHGLLQPILVRPFEGHEDLYQIIAGERRWMAAQKAQLHEVPVIIRALSDIEAFEIALIENLQREALGPIDEALAYKKLIEEYGHTQAKLAKIVGKSRPHIANITRLLALPDIVQGYLEAGEITIGHARALIGSEKAEQLVKEIVKKGLSVRQTEQLVAEDKELPASADRKEKAEKDTDTQALEKEISNMLGMRVTIDSRNGKSGKLTVQFKSLDQLDDLLRRLSGGG